jgi:hypothetical protein
MTKFFEKYSGPFMLVCLTMILMFAIKNYLDKGYPMYTQLCIIFALTPSMIQGFKPELKETKNFKYFSGLMVTLAAGMLIAAFYY